MDYIRFAIQNPVKVAVGVLLTVLFGLIALFQIPIQLTPNVDQPIITIETNWTGRSPQEVEKDIVQEQEKKLDGVTGLKKMTSTASQGGGEIELEFHLGTNMDRALQEVSDKLREVPEYPDDVDEPVVTVADSAQENAMAWLVLTSDDPSFDVAGFFDTADRRIRPQLERVGGVGEINIYGGRERQVHVQVDPRDLAQRGISFSALVSALRGENVNVSAGELSEGRLDVRVRTIGQYDTLDQVRQTVVAYDESGGPIRVGDLAEVDLTLQKRRSFVRSRGQPAMAFQVIRKTGSNVIEAMHELRLQITRINEQVLPAIAPGAKIQQVYDETVYIDDAVSLVQWNLVIGGTLAGLVLLAFLRTVRPTAVVAMSIPISIIGTFVVMTAAGRNLNVISLAGLAFAVGMVVDAAIVVLENIDRHLLMGKPVGQAAYDGAREVWGAILASTLTTVAVFVPILTVQDEAGQLFRDIAIAICAAVLLSLVVSITVIPSASARFLRSHDDEGGHGQVLTKARGLWGLTGVLNRFVDLYSSLIYRLTDRTPRRVWQRVGIVAAFTVTSLLGAYLLMPPSSYLPAGNRNLVFGIMFNPPGYSLDHAGVLGDRIETKVRPYWEASTYDELAGLPPVASPMPPFAPMEDIPPIENYFFVSFGGTVFMGASSVDKTNVEPLAGLLTSAMFANPGSFGFATQTSLFGRGLGGTNTIDIEISAADLVELGQSTQAVEARLIDLFGRHAVRADPSNYALPGPELQVRTDPVKAADLQVDRAAMGLGVQALIDGAVVGDYRYDGDTIDLLLVRDPSIPISTDTIGQVPVAVYDRLNDRSAIVPLSSIAKFTRADAPQQIKRIEQQRSIKLTVDPEGVPLETATGQIESVVGQMRSDGSLPPAVRVNLAGTADKLTQVRQTLLGRWHGPTIGSLLSLGGSRMFLALLVTFLLMAALFESFLYPAVIMFSVPLATIGGFIGLALVHAADPSQQLDTLTMLGFVILIGIVVNNAILIVHQALNFMRGLGEGAGDVTGALQPREAIRESVRSRIRPIFMTTATSVCGMLPLVLMPGSGSELYKGLGSVVIGGLIVSTIFTLVVVPLLFSLVLDLKYFYLQLRGGGSAQAVQSV